MEEQAATSFLDLETRIRRSKGRTGRTISATARVTRDEQNEMERQLPNSKAKASASGVGILYLPLHAARRLLLASPR